MNSTAKKILVLLVAISVIGFVIVYLIIVPTVKDIEAISNSVYLERVDLEKKYLRGQLLRKTIEDFEKIKPQRDKLQSVFINEGDELDFITTLEDVANKYNLSQDLRLKSLESLIIEQELGEKDFYEVPLGITIQGDFINVLKYLREMESLNYYYNISQIKVANSSTGLKSQNSLVTVTLEGDVFIIPKSIEKETEISL